MAIQNKIWQDNTGFSLLEIIVTIMIMATVMTISAMSFSSWQKKNNIEKQTRDIYGTLMEARNNSFMQKKQHGVVFQPKSYVMYSYSSETDTVGTSVKRATLVYTLTKGGSSSDISGVQIKFDTSGFTTVASNNTIIVNPLDAAASLNCLVVSSTRVNLGKMNGTTCEFR